VLRQDDGPPMYDKLFYYVGARRAMPAKKNGSINLNSKSKCCVIEIRKIN
jgi:hypothetical protein